MYEVGTNSCWHPIVVGKKSNKAHKKSVSFLTSDESEADLLDRMADVRLMVPGCSG